MVGVPVTLNRTAPHKQLPLIAFLPPKPPINVEILDMIEGSDRVAVRWQLTATSDEGKPYERSIMAIYRFENGRIAEDWGISIPALWP